MLPVKQHIWNFREAAMKLYHSKNFIPEIWEKGKAINVQEKMSVAGMYLGCAACFLSTLSSTVGNGKA